MNPLPEDAASVLEQFVQDVSNTPAEITHLLEEIHAKDIKIQAYKDEIYKRDAQLQKWVRLNGGHVLNPKEEAFTKTINDCYDKCEILQAEKCGLAERASIILERQMKKLDTGLRALSATEQFPSDWNGPSLLTGTPTGTNTPAAGGGGAVPHMPLQAVSANIGTAAGAPNVANAAQMRLAQNAASASRASSTGNQTPPAIPRAQREGSSEANKRRRPNVSLGNLPTASSNLRQSSLGPGTPKAGTPGPNGTGSQRAGSAQPTRPTGPSHKKVPPPSSRKSNPRIRHAGGTKNRDRRRQLARDRATPSTNASASGSDDENDSTATPSSLPRSQHDGSGDRADDEEGDDETLYCLCQKVSFGDMVGCDNDNCKYQWFHYKCVGVTEEPAGEWLCPNCRTLPRSKLRITKD